MDREFPQIFGTATVGEKGQIVIPSEARKAMDLAPGSRILVMSAPRGKAIVIMKAEQAEQMMQHISGRLGLMRDKLKQHLADE